MNQPDTSAGVESESDVDTARTVVRSGRESVAKASPYLRRGVESGAVTALLGGASILGGLRALLSGKRKRGIAKIALGAAFVAATIKLRSRAPGSESDVEESDVVDTGPDIESIADETGGAGETDHAADEEAGEIADTSLDLEDVESELDSESDTDADSASVGQREIVDTGIDSEDLSEATERETGGAGVADETSGEPTTGPDAALDVEPDDIDRLGEAAFDSQSREVPAPQRAFNQGFLAHSSEVFWGVRSRDDAVLISLDYDALEDREGVEYVASSEIGEDVRELPIPDGVLDHWDGVIGDGTAVTGGDDILFATTDDLAADGLLWVLPAAWADDASE